MAQIFNEGNVIAHIPNGSKEPYAHCYDARDEDFRTLIVIDLFTFLPENFGDENPDHEIPSWSFLIEAIQTCVKHQEQLWAAWETIKDDPEV